MTEQFNQINTDPFTNTATGLSTEELMETKRLQEQATPEMSVGDMVQTAVNEELGESGSGYPSLQG